MNQTKNIKSIIRNVILFLIILLIWYMGSQHANQLFLPKPKAVFNTFMILVNNGVLDKSIAASFYRVTMATTLSIVISVILGLLMFGIKFLNNIITPITNVIRYFPSNAFYPLLILWIGIDENMKITFLFLVTFVYFLPNIIMCLKEVDKRLVETGYTMGMNTFQVITQIILPYSLPSICKSILLSYGMAWTYVPIAEMTNAENGLGHLINIGSARGRTDMVFVAIIVIMIISWIIDYIGSFLIRKIFHWKYLISVDE